VYEDKFIRYIITAVCPFDLFLDPEDGGGTFLRKVRKLISDYMTQHPTTYYSS
jgi:hypothetical protein